MYGDYTISNSIDLSALEGSGDLRCAVDREHNVAKPRRFRSPRLGGGFTVHDNQALTNLDGLSGLTQVVGDFTIETNPLLQNLMVFKD